MSEIPQHVLEQMERDDDATADRIASLTEAVRVLTEALEKADTVFADPIFAADHTIDLQGRASEEEYNAAIAIREALTTAKELTK